jgi:hypothetical protein
MKRILLAVLMLTATSAWAEWAQFSETGNGVYYIDPATIRKDGKFRKVWEVLDLSERNQDGVKSIRTLTEYDCNEQRHRTLAFSAHNESVAGGNPLASDNSTGAWKHIAPRTVAEGVFKFVCAK